MLHHLAIDLVDPIQLGLAVDAVEDGETAEENARIKALAYLDAAGIPTFSLDAALRIDGLPHELQPDVRVPHLP
jgi:inosine/xanthosine triphosphate pyrophosphatase family protein